MPSKFTSPYTSSFKSGISSGKSCWTVINNIATRTKKPFNTIIKSLCNAGVCCSVKFNGHYVCWPTFSPKCPITTVNNCQWNMWQHFVDWCVTSGCCTPNQLTYNCTNQKALMNFCRNFFSKQFNTTNKTWHKPRTSVKPGWPTPVTKARKHSKSKGKSRKTTSSWNRSYSNPRSYKFPTYKSRTSATSRRYAKAA